MNPVIPFIIFTLLQLGDIWTTHKILTAGGRELNPILAKLFQWFGHLPVLVVLKAVIVYGVWLLIPEWTWLIWALVALYWWIVVVHNAKHLPR